MITWRNVKDELVDLGFEEDNAIIEYSRIAVNATNRALRLLKATVIPQIEDYLRGKWGYEFTDKYGRKQWKFPSLIVVTQNTPDKAAINVPEVLEPLVPLLAAHYLWLDDDLTKATIYWNEYDDLKTQIISTAKIPRNAQIVGGF